MPTSKPESARRPPCCSGRLPRRRPLTGWGNGVETPARRRRRSAGRRTSGASRVCLHRGSGNVDGNHRRTGVLCRSRRASEPRGSSTRSTFFPGATMLLAIDVGNTNITLGLYDGDRPGPRWRNSTDHDRMADEYGILMIHLFQALGHRSRRHSRDLHGFGCSPAHRHSGSCLPGLPGTDAAGRGCRTQDRRARALR